MTVTSFFKARVTDLEEQLESSNELITQLKHNLSSKTDLLHAYNDAALDDYSPIRNKVSFESLQKKIRALEEENKLVRISCPKLQPSIDYYCKKTLSEKNFGKFCQKIPASSTNWHKSLIFTSNVI